MNLYEKQLENKQQHYVRTASIVLTFLFILVMGPTYAAWNPKSLFEGIVDTATYLAAVAWAIYLITLGIQRKFLWFGLVFFFGGLGLSLLNSNTKDYAINMLGAAWRAILGA
ncbi:hypothetical protein BHU72_14480 [Desulfuribacillus stibiiarsenatis]|uniref:Uncharacterized protein n=1 Tax=Desulfuribacillus stibiiarsenatis TaxID=1390249 RepID=A0A1E5L7C0_9FIRM|nr:hypothetical protein [Desulfuribacillus stibiiarsenatis]OEH86035.1 hypothetical protein BHU72_14480 [Desulfuribacillus stibiiarsenatis]